MGYLLVIKFVDYLRVIGAWNTHKVGELAQTQEIVKYYSNSSGNYSITYINKWALYVLPSNFLSLYWLPNT